MTFLCGNFWENNVISKNIFGHWSKNVSAGVVETTNYLSRGHFFGANNFQEKHTCYNFVWTLSQSISGCCQFFSTSLEKLFWKVEISEKISSLLRLSGNLLEIDNLWVWAKTFRLVLFFFQIFHLNFFQFCQNCSLRLYWNIIQCGNLWNRLFSFTNFQALSEGFSTPFVKTAIFMSRELFLEGIFWRKTVDIYNSFGFGGIYFECCEKCLLRVQRDILR